jgi:hypothetical protein
MLQMVLSVTTRLPPAHQPQKHYFAKQTHFCRMRKINQSQNSPAPTSTFDSECPELTANSTVATALFLTKKRG